MATPYTIKQGDTLGGIAQANNTTVANLQSYNPNITDVNKIQAGENLNLSPVNTTVDASKIGLVQTTPVPATQPVTYTTPVVTQPSGTTVDKTGVATYTPPATTETKTPEKTGYQQMLEKLGIATKALADKPAETLKAQEEAQVAAKRDASIASYNAYNKASLDFAQQLQAKQTAEANIVGGVGGGYSAEVQKFEREGRAKLANMSVQANMDANNLTGAIQNVKDKIDAQFQPVQDEIDNYVKLSSVISNDLTESEKFKLQEIATQNKNDLEAVQKVANDVSQNVVNNGNPAGVLSSLDKITNDFQSGKISASEAQSKYYQVAGSAGSSKTATTLGESGMTAGQTATFNSIVNKYSASPLIAASDRTIVLKNSIEEARKDPSNGAKQLNLVYSYVQALDTYQSAVREGELYLVNSIDSKIGKVSNSVQQIQNGQIVRPEVIKQIADAAQGLVSTISEGAKNKENQYASQATVSGVGTQWNSYINGFKQTYNQSVTGDKQVETKSVEIKPEDNAIFNSVVKPVKTQMSSLNDYQAPSFNLSSFFK